MEFSHSFPSVTFAVLTVDQFVEHGVELCWQKNQDSHDSWRNDTFPLICWKNRIESSLHKRRSLRNWENGMEFLTWKGWEDHFITSVNSFHPALKYTWEISETSIAFLDIKVSINGNGLSTSVHYKPTDSHSYLLHSSSHPFHVKNSIPFSQFLRLRRLCSDDSDFSSKSEEMCHFFKNRGYPDSVVNTAQHLAQQIDRQSALQTSHTVSIETNPHVCSIPIEAFVYNSSPLGLLIICITDHLRATVRTSHRARWQWNFG